MADHNPHTHKVSTTPTRNGGRTYYIQYGDQGKWLNTKAPFWKSRMKRKIRRMIKAHDRGSVTNPAVYIDQFKSEVNDRLLEKIESPHGTYPRERKDTWGKDLLKSKVDA